VSAYLGKYVINVMHPALRSCSDPDQSSVRGGDMLIMISDSRQRIVDGHRQSIPIRNASSMPRRHFDLLSLKPPGGSMVGYINDNFLR